MLEKNENPITIEKPITVARQDFISNIANVINGCNLPLFVIEPILKDVYLEIKSLSEKQYEMEKADYENKIHKYAEQHAENVK